MSLLERLVRRPTARKAFGGVAAALLLVGAVVPTDTAAATSEQRRCIATVQAGAAAIVDSQLRVGSKCLAAFDKGKLATPEACLGTVAAPADKVARKIASLVGDEAKRCVEPALPDFGFSDSSTTAQGAQGAALDLLHGLFGDSLDDAALDPSLSKSDRKRHARCRSKVQRALSRLIRGAWAVFADCADDAIEGGVATDAATLVSACLATDGSGPVDAKGKITDRERRLADEVLRCSDEAGVALDPMETFHGSACSAQTPATLAPCLADRARCRLCLAVDAAGDLTADCDLVDDGTDNASCSAVSVPAPIETIEVLFVGNSYTSANGLTSMLGALSESDGSSVHIHTGMAVRGGATWGGHSTDPATLAAIDQGWDYVVLQDQSLQPLSYTHTVKASAYTLDARVRAAGAETVLFMTWPRAYHDLWYQHFYPLYYNNNGHHLGAAVAPVARAWARSQATRPDLGLYIYDESHPSVTGTYLAAATFYATLTGASPVGLEGGNPGFSAEDLLDLQTAAWEAYQATLAPAAPLSVEATLALGATEDFIVTPGLTIGDRVGPDGSVGGATGFDGDDYASMPYRPEFYPTEAFTAGLFVYRDDWSEATAASETLFHNAEGWEAFVDGTTVNAAVTVDDGGAVLVDLAFDAASLTSGWHHFAVSYDGTTVVLHADGVAVADAAATGPIFYGADESLEHTSIVFGAAGGYPGPAEVSDAFTGALAGFRLYDHAVDAAILTAWATP